MKGTIFLANYYSQTGPSLVVEDDGRVCYAYFFSAEGRIVGDVWLYNRAPAPETPEWVAKQDDPYLNPVGYVKEQKLFDLPNKEDDFEIVWATQSDTLWAYIFIRDILVGKVTEGLKPGYALTALKDGPLAKILLAGSECLGSRSSSTKH